MVMKSSSKNPDDTNNGSSANLREVELDFVNPFLSALHATLKSMTMGQTTAHKGALSLVKANVLSGDTLIFLRVDGALKGLVVLAFQEEFAKKLVSTFLLGVPIIELDEMAKNALVEFSLRISELAHNHLVKKGYPANISFHINYNKPIQFTREHQFLVVPLNTAYGKFDVFFKVAKTALAEKETPDN
jgi:chemotaxis protein CheX